jgi:hypothetical protein
VGKNNKKKWVCFTIAVTKYYKKHYYTLLQRAFSIIFQGINYTNDEDLSMSSTKTLTLPRTCYKVHRRNGSLSAGWLFKEPHHGNLSCCLQLLFVQNFQSSFAIQNSYCGLCHVPLTGTIVLWHMDTGSMFKTT